MKLTKLLIVLGLLFSVSQAYAEGSSMQENDDAPCTAVADTTTDTTTSTEVETETTGSSTDANQ